MSSPRPKEAYMTERKKKLIEVSLPLEAINAASAREKSIRHGVSSGSTRTIPFGGTRTTVD